MARKRKNNDNEKTCVNIDGQWVPVDEAQERIVNNIVGQFEPVQEPQELPCYIPTTPHPKLKLWGMIGYIWLVGFSSQLLFAWWIGMIRALFCCTPAIIVWEIFCAFMFTFAYPGEVIDDKLIKSKYWFKVVEFTEDNLIKGGVVVAVMGVLSALAGFIFVTIFFGICAAKAGVDAFGQL